MQKARDLYLSRPDLDRNDKQTLEAPLASHVSSWRFRERMMTKVDIRRAESTDKVSDSISAARIPSL